MINPRTRMAAITGSLALTATLLAAPAALAQDEGPEAAFQDFADTFASLDLAALPTYFCADQAVGLGGLGVAELVEGIPPGLEFMLDAFDIQIDFESLDVVSQTDTEAVVDVVATMSTGFDVEGIMPMFVGLMESLGASEEEIAQMQAETLGEVPVSETARLEGQVTLVPGETRSWVICSDLGGLMAVDDMSDMSGDDMDEAMEEATDEAMEEATDRP